MVENWCEEGAIRSRFAMFDHPASVEHRSLSERSPYVSYPVGSQVPPYLLARLTGCRPTPALLMGYDLANHLAIALLLAGLGFAMARATTSSALAAFLFGLVPAAVVLLNPGPMYWLQNVYFTDQAVVLPFAAALLLEWLRSEPSRAGRLARVVQPAVVFWGCSVD